jgi:hypothetical protein
LIMEEVQSFDECSGPAECGDQGCLIMGNEAFEMSAECLPMSLSLKTHNEYSQILLSKVSAPVFWSEHTLFGLVSMLLHFKGSWKPNVLLRYLGWKNPSKPVSVPLANEEVWLARKRFFQLPLLEMYFSTSLSFPPSPDAI